MEVSGLPLRQVHLDFHTSPHIPDVGCEFDPAEFAATFKKAHVNSVTVFAKCHHGMCYWDAKTGPRHPALGKLDLMGEQIEALHREGIRAPIYFTVGWEEESARVHPEWRQVRADGSFARAGTHPGAWWFMNFTHPDYLDLMEAQVREILARYPVDGFWFDILFMEGESCWSAASREFRGKHGLLGRDPATHAKFETAAQDAFARRFAGLVKDKNPEATLFFNNTNRLFTDSRIGARVVGRHETELDIESLPSGFWGYHHFPRMARQLSHWGKPWLGMTGRFQRMWGDFGGIKPRAALEYECFRSQALGGGNSVGDQLPPRGRLEPAAYDLTGAVYAEVEKTEPFYAGSDALPQVGIVVPHFPGGITGEADKSLEGAVMVCEEAHYEAAVVDDGDDHGRFDLLILPDSVTMTPLLRDALRRYAGKLLVSYRSGFAEGGKWALDSLPLSFDGEAEAWPTYWRVRREAAPGMAGSDRVFYQRGMNVAAEGLTILADRVLPYFQRTDEHFSSHAQTPPVAKPGAYPAAVAGDRFVYFADPVFREYRQSGNLAARDLVKVAMERLAGPPPFGAGLPTTVLMVPRRRGTDLILSLLHYIPVRKALEIDVIEERMSFAGLLLRLPARAERARIFGSGEDLARNPSGGFILPAVNGRLLLEVPGYFG